MLKRYKIPLITVFLILFIDQFIKLYIKLHYPLGEIARPTDWCVIHFTENPGMAFGFEFGGDFGKLALSVFRIIACIGGILYIRYIIKQKEHPGFIFSVSLILAGALGNILDSAFYGLIFDRGTVWNADYQRYMDYDGIASLTTHGYAKSMYGCVVDMFHFPLINGTFPDWFPIWAGEEFQFFRPIFNFADASISAGVIIIILFQKRFAKKVDQQPAHENQITETENNPAADLNTNHS